MDLCQSDFVDTSYDDCNETYSKEGLWESGCGFLEDPDSDVDRIIKKETE